MIRGSSLPQPVARGDRRQRVGQGGHRPPDVLGPSVALVVQFIGHPATLGGLGGTMVADVRRRWLSRPTTQVETATIVPTAPNITNIIWRTTRAMTMVATSPATAGTRLMLGSAGGC